MYTRIQFLMIYALHNIINFSKWQKVKDMRKLKIVVGKGSSQVQ